MFHHDLIFALKMGHPGWSSVAKFSTSWTRMPIAFPLHIGGKRYIVSLCWFFFSNPFCFLPSSYHQRMPSLGEIQLLVHKIVSLACNSIFSAQNATKYDYDKIYKVMHTTDGETPHETFNRWFDALFGEDCRNSSGHLREARNGSCLQIPLWNSLEQWFSSGSCWNQAKTTFWRAKNFIVCLYLFFKFISNVLPGKHNHDHCAKLFLLWSSQIRTMWRSPNLLFNTRSLPIFAHNKLRNLKI